MLKWLAKIVIEKVVTLLLGVLAIGVLILLLRYRHEIPGYWNDLLASAHWALLFLARLALWLGVACLLPWATFFLVRWVQKAESNVPATGLLAAWAAVDGGLAWWLAGGWPRSAQWIVAIVAFGLGGLYNLIAANHIASRKQR